MFPTYNLLCLDASGTWGWITSRGSFQVNPFFDIRSNTPMVPADCGFRLAVTGGGSTGWKRSFYNGYILVTDLSGMSHEYGETARLAYFDHQDLELASYEIDRRHVLRRLAPGLSLETHPHFRVSDSNVTPE
jgi:hypothetical protein